MDDRNEQARKLEILRRDHDRLSEEYRDKDRELERYKRKVEALEVEDPGQKMRMDTYWNDLWWTQNMLQRISIRVPFVVGDRVNTALYGKGTIMELCKDEDGVPDDTFAVTTDSGVSFVLMPQDIIHVWEKNDQST